MRSDSDGIASARPRHGSTRRTALRILLAAVALVVVGAVGVAVWALDRFVIDHVEISNVSEYEQQNNGSTVTLATFPP